MLDRDDIARLEEENRNLRAMLADVGSINSQEVQMWRDKIERNIISIERAKAGKE